MRRKQSPTREIRILELILQNRGVLILEGRDVLIFLK